MSKIHCSTCGHDLPASSFPPFRRTHGGRCRSCDAIAKRDERRRYTGLSPAEALEELWRRIQRGRRIPKLLTARIEILTAAQAA